MKEYIYFVNKCKTLKYLAGLKIYKTEVEFRGKTTYDINFLIKKYATSSKHTTQITAVVA